MPTFTDNFEAGTLNADVGASPDWTVLAGSWIYTDVGGDRGANPDTPGSTSNNTLRATADMGSPNMYAEAVFTELKTGRKHAVTVRMNTTGATFYWGGWVGTAWQIRRVTTGPNTIGSILVNGDTTAPTVPWTARLQVEDNASGDPVLTLYSDGVQKAQFTDTATAKITAGNFGGMFETTNTGHRGSFSVASLSVVPTVATPDDATHGHTSDTVGVTQTHNVTPDPTSHSHTADSPAIAVTHHVSADNTTHGHAVESPAVTQTHTVAPSNTVHSHTAEQPAVVPPGQAQPDSTVHGHTADSPAVLVTHHVTPDDSLHTHTAESPTVTGGLSVTPADSTHSHTATGPGVIQYHQVAPDSTVHAHTTDQVSVLDADITTPATRIHTIPSESRTYTIPSDPRVTTVPPENRTVRI